MTNYRLTYESVTEDGSDGVVVTYDIEARNDRWAMQMGNERLTEEPGNNAWSIVSIEVIPDAAPPAQPANPNQEPVT